MRLWLCDERPVPRRGRCPPCNTGPRIQAQSVLLNVDYRLPFAKIRQFWVDLTGYGYNPATLVSVQTMVDEQLVPIEAQI